MNRYEIMRRIICGLMVWNLILTAGIMTHCIRENNVPVEEQICNLEMIPLEPLEGDLYVDRK